MTVTSKKKAANRKAIKRKETSNTHRTGPESTSADPLAAGLKSSADRQPMIAERIGDASGLDVNEIIGALVQQMRGNLHELPSCSEILATAEGDVSLAKRLKQRERFIPQGRGRPPFRDITITAEIRNPQEATRQLIKILGMKNMPLPSEVKRKSIEESLQRIVEEAKASGITLTDEQKKEIEEKLGKAYLHPSK